MASKIETAGTWTYVWDFENRLTEVINPASQNVQYEYDALGRRTKRTENTSVTKFTYDGMDVVLDDDTATGITKYQNGLGVDNKLKLSNGTTAKYFIQDHLGSTNALTDQSGSVLQTATYDSFGNSTNTLGTRYQFTDREEDDFSGLTYYRARWYDSKLGRFVSEDPIGLAGGNQSI
jgi:RHS repeat-associated protein